MTKKRDYSEFSLDEIEELARKSGLEARQESLDAGIEVMSQDEEGNLILEKKSEDGSIVVRRLDKQSKD